MRALARFTISALALCLAALPAQSARKVALVIGNANYKLAPLINPTNDARDLTSSLKRLGFTVTEKQDLDVRGFDDAVDAFVDEAKDADVAVLYFSGHGVQIDKRGYLAPIDIKAESESSALRELVPIQELVSKVENAAKVALVILDACRDSPLQERLRRIASDRHKTLVADKGLPAISVLGSNTLVVYATAPGETAEDGKGQRNSPFTTALLQHIETPGLEVELMFKRVTADVLRVTRGTQQPERLSRLQSELVLLDDPTDLSDWNAVVAKPTRGGVADYVAQHPHGKYVGVARSLSEQITRQEALDAALREEARRREEADRREAELKAAEQKLREEEARRRAEAERLEAERQAREALATPSKPEPAPAADAEDARKQAEAAQRAAEELERIKEDVRKANEAAAEAEKRRKAAEKAAEKAASDTKAAGEAKTRKGNRPTNLSAYSLQYWPRNSFQYRGQTQTTNTPYGRLSCTSNGSDTPRSCSLD